MMADLSAFLAGYGAMAVVRDLWKLWRAYRGLD